MPPNRVNGKCPVSKNLNNHISRVVERAKNFYQKTECGHFLINALIAVETPRIPPLYDFDLDRELNRWFDYNLAALRPAWQAKEGLDDDSIPSACPHFGIAEHTAWIGTDVLLQETTSLPVPMVHIPDDLERLVCNEHNKWFGYMKSGYEYLRSRKDGSFVLSVRGAMGPMDVANAVRDNELFVDFLQQPDFVHRLMDRLVGAIRWYYKHLS